MKLPGRRLETALFFCALALASCAQKRPAREAPAAETVAPSIETPPAEAAPPVSLPRVEPEAVVKLDRAPTVRVLIVEGGKPVRLEIPAAYLVAVDPAAKPATRMERGGDLAIHWSDGEAVLVDGRRRVLSAARIYIEPAGSGRLSANGKPYRGGFLFAAARSGGAAINVLEIDEYLKGVLPAEIGYLKPEQYEAFRAQAIAARAYALSKLEEKRGQLFDLNATIMDQVYRGASGESEEANRAVDETRGLVCTFLGQPLRAYYCSCCGGHTADIRVVWPWKTPFPYLYGVRDTVPETPGESLCRGSRHFRWRVHWSAASLGSILRKTIPRELKVPGSDVGRLIGIEVLGVSRDGRAQGIEIATDRGSFTVMGDRIRWVMKPDPASEAILRSTLFNMDVSLGGDRVAAVDILGGGNGHGVGMCQAGAIRMAELGYRGEDIIAHYYPGSRIVKLYP